MIRFTPSNNAKPESGDILLSEPFLDDPYFGRKLSCSASTTTRAALGLS